MGAAAVRYELVVKLCVVREWLPELAAGLGCFTVPDLHSAFCARHGYTNRVTVFRCVWELVRAGRVLPTTVTKRTGARGREAMVFRWREAQRPTIAEGH